MTACEACIWAGGTEPPQPDPDPDPDDTEGGE